MNKPRRMLLALMLLMLITLLSGCKIDHEITINNDLSGTAVTKILTFGVISPDNTREHLEKHGIKNFTITSIKEDTEFGNGITSKIDGLQIATSWKTVAELNTLLEALVGKRIETPIKRNDDGTVSVNFGVLGSGTTKVRFEGAIDPQSTKGKFNNNNYIEFSADQPVMFKYTPPNGIWKWAVFIGFGIVAAGVFAIYYVRGKFAETDPISSTVT